MFRISLPFPIPHAKLLRKLGELDSEQLSQVEDVLLFWLGFDDIVLDEES
jgi:mRNA interferase MazF